MRRTIGIIVGFLIVAGFFKAGYYTVHYGGTDLRDRVVAARMLDSGKAVYYYKWVAGDPERLLNPNAPRDAGVNGVTSPPGTLYVQSVFGFLDYPVLRMVWLVVQYGLCLYIFGFFLFRKRTVAGDMPASENHAAALADSAALFRDNQFYVFAIGGVFFLCSQIWLFHIERGQIYIFYAFLFCLIYQLYERPEKWAHFFAGVVVAIAIYCRPAFIVFLIPLCFAFNRWTISGLLLCGIPLTLHAYLHMDLWKGYLSAMAVYTDLKKGVAPAMGTATVSSPEVSSPEVIEGARNLLLYKTDFICGGISPLNTRLGGVFKIRSNYFYVILYGVAVLLSVAAFRKKLRRKNPEDIVLFGFLLYILAEFVMPASRGAYHLIVWIFPVLLFLQKPRFPPSSYVVLVAGLCFMNAFPFYFPFLHDAGELLLVCYLIRYLAKAPENDGNGSTGGSLTRGS